MINLLNAVITGVISKNISDEEAVKNYQITNNVSFFNVLYERYSGKVFAKCFSMLKDEMEAEDAMQDIFLKVIMKISSFEGKSKFSTWLFSITYNFCIDNIRRMKKDITTEVEDISALGGHETEDTISDAEIKEISLVRLKFILNEIGADDKAVLLMKYQDDMSIKEMCEVFNKSESAVKMQIKRAKERFIKIHNKLYT